MSNKYLVISPNNYGNVGDDICAYAGKKAIELADPSAEVVVSQPPMKKRLVEEADYIVLSGGGIIYDRHYPNVDNYMQYIDMAHELGKKSAVLGVGVQGIVTSKGKKRYVEALSKCEFVSVRTEKDKKLLEDAGFKGAVSTFDIAYFTPQILSDIQPGLVKSFVTKFLTRKVMPSAKPRVGIVMINLKMLKRENYGGPFKFFDDSVEDFIRNGREKFDIFLMQHAGEDGEIMRKLAKKYNVHFVPYSDIDDMPALFELYNSLDFMLGVRLHSIALGIMAKIPVIGIGSATAKQLRLANYGLPTLKKQFFTFGEIEKLPELLQKIIDEPKLPIHPLTDEEYAFIDEKNNLNLELLRTMIKP